MTDTTRFFCRAAALLALAALAPASAQDADARLGWAGDVSGVHAAAAAPFQTVDGTRHAGAVRFYAYGTAWDEAVEVPSPTGTAGTLFGYAVALDGDLAVVGAPGAQEAGLLAGAAYVYRYAGGAWQLDDTLAPQAPTLGGRSGLAVETAHGLVAVASWAGCGESGKGGCVDVYRQSGGAWAPVAQLALPDDYADAAFGSSLQIPDASTVVVGAPTSSYGTDRGGEVAVFREGTDGWALAQRLTLGDATMGDLFGESVAATSGVLFVGSPGRSTGDETGAVTVFTDRDGTYEETATLAPPSTQDHQLFGQSLAVADGRLLVGAPRKDVTDAPDTGEVYVYTVGDAVSYVGALGASDAADESGFGYHVRTDGTTDLLGAPFSTVGETAGAGRVELRDPTGATAIDGPAAPRAFALHEASPNPFRQSTTLRYALPAEGHVTLALYNVLGQRIAVLVDARQAAGTHDVALDAADLASGVYVAELAVGDRRATRKVTVLR